MPTLSPGISYDSTTNVYSVSTLVTATSLQAAIGAASSGSVFRFAAGEYNFDKPISVKNDNISLIGAGQEKTVFVFHHSTNVDSSLNVTGTYKSYSGTLSADADQSDNSITLKSTSGLKAGDVLHIQQENTTEFLKANGYSNIVGSSNAEKNPINETIVKIKSISGNTVTLETPITHDMDASYTTVKVIDPVDNVRLQGFTVTYDLGTPDPDKIADEEPGLSGLIAIYLNKTTDAYVHDVAVKNAPSHNMEIRSSLTPAVDGFYGNGAFNKGDTGNGYGLQIAETYGGKFDNLTLMNHRHAVVFSAWHTETDNYVHVLETNRDINYHGGPDHSNTVIVDRDLYRSGDTIWRLVSPGGSKHPYTDISDNTTLFGVASAGAKEDVIYGWNDNAWLSGGAGQDTLYGGQGNDVLIGGADYDTLSGRSGQDVFAFRPNEGRDTIKDFQAGSGGDKILLNGFSNVDGFSDLKFSSITNGTRVTVAGTDIDLLGVSSSKLTAENFLFNKPSYLDVPTGSVPVPPPTTTPTPEVPIIGDFFATISNDTIVGTSKSEIVTTWMGQLNSGDKIDMGTGTDTLLILNTGLDLKTANYDLKGIERIDITAANGNASIILDKAFILASDTDSITIVYGSKMPTGLGFADFSSDDVIITQGTGEMTIKLAPVSTPAPEPDPSPSTEGVTLSLSSKADKLSGTDGDDTVTSYASQIQTSDVIAFGEGHDQLIMKTKGFDFVAGNYRGITGLDAIDLTLSPGTSAVTLDKTFLQSTDNGSFTILHSTAELEKLTVTGLSADEYTLTKQSGKTVVTLVSSGAEEEDEVTPDPTPVPSTPDPEPTSPDEVEVTVTNSSLTSKSTFDSGNDGSPLHLNIAGLTSAATLKVTGDDNVVLERGSSSVVVTVQAENGFSGSITGSDGREVLYGNSSLDDLLYGGGHDDILYGGGGNDVLGGGSGNDSLYGGSGKDTFLYQSTSDGYDRVLDFEAGDVIDLQQLFDENNLGGVTKDEAFAKGYLGIVELSGGDAKIVFDADGAFGGRGASSILRIDDADKDLLLMSPHIIV